mgnify:CR=1 FL=1
MPVRMKWFYKWNCQPLYFSYARCRRETQFAFIHLFPLATMWWTALSLPLFFNTSRIEANKPEEVASSGNGGYFEWWNSHGEAKSLMLMLFSRFGHLWSQISLSIFRFMTCFFMGDLGISWNIDSYLQNHHPLTKVPHHRQHQTWGTTVT